MTPAGTLRRLPPTTSVLYVRSAVGRDTYAVQEYDPATGELGEVIYGNDVVDVSGGPLVMSPKDNRLVAIDFEYERPERIWLDEEMAAIQESIDAALPDTVNVATTISDGRATHAVPCLQRPRSRVPIICSTENPTALSISPRA